MNKKTYKYYVDMIVFRSREGKIRPLYLYWDNCRFKIDRIVSIKETFSKAGGLGKRYECWIEGKPHYLFMENSGKWFIESDQAYYNE